MNELFDTDILVWSEDQATRLCQLAAGERVHDPLDRTNLIEAIERLGHEQPYVVGALPRAPSAGPAMPYRQSRPALPSTCPWPPDELLGNAGDAS